MAAPKPAARKGSPRASKKQEPGNRSSLSFYRDISFPNLYHAVIVRSTIVRGKIISLTPPALPKGFSFFSARDIPGKNSIETFNSSVPLFAEELIQYEGEPLGMIVGPDRREAEQLALQVIVEAEVLPPLLFSPDFEPEQVLAQRIVTSPPPAEEAKPDAEPDTETAGEQIMAEPLTAVTTYRTPPSYQNFGEPPGAVASFNGETLEIYTPTQWPYHLREAVAGAAGIDEKAVFIQQTIPGETTSGGIWFPSMAAAQVSVAAVLLQKTVRLACTRQEDYQYISREAPAEITHKTDFDASGKLLSMDVRILIDGGAYSPLIEEIVDRTAIAAAGIYAPKQFKIEVYALRSSKPPMGAGYDWGEAWAFYAVESHIQQIAALSGVSPDWIKHVNTLTPERKTITGVPSKSSSAIPLVLDAVIDMSDFQRKYTAYEYLSKRRSSLKDGPLRGIGMAAAWQGNGFLGSSQSKGSYTLEVVMETDSSLTVKMNSYSASILQIWKKTAADILEISPEQVHFDQQSAAASGSSAPETLSSNIVIMTRLLRKCCEAIQKQRFREPLPITVKKIFKPGRKGAWNSKDFTGLPYSSRSWGAAVVEVEIDPATYQVQILNLNLAVEGGEILLEKSARNTLMKGISRVLAKTVHDDTLIRTSGIPKIVFIPSDDEAKGIGEIAYSLIPGAFSAAVNQAIEGILKEDAFSEGSSSVEPITQLPIAAEGIFKRLQQEQKGGEG
ncbi:MAG: molybdopterin-dependent oxidoreductase [Spirochaetaceae bacterium]|jgi:CO/xanthine dehydrogenase Mo-binding subunit|nr:molybdopterin-dependent oxidoreductase [Spirochaetaceae bacterium]